MIPNKLGYYWIKTKGSNGEISDWFPAVYDSGKDWETMGYEYSVESDAVVEIGPEIVPPGPEVG